MRRTAAIIHPNKYLVQSGVDTTTLKFGVKGRPRRFCPALAAKSDASRLMPFPDQWRSSPTLTGISSATVPSSAATRKAGWMRQTLRLPCVALTAPAANVHARKCPKQHLAGMTVRLGPFSYFAAPKDPEPGGFFPPGLVMVDFRSRPRRCCPPARGLRPRPSSDG